MYRSSGSRILGLYTWLFKEDCKMYMVKKIQGYKVWLSLQ